jgi:hypothetical protein
MNKLGTKVKTGVKGFVKRNKTKIIVGGMAIGVVAYKIHINSVKRDVFKRASIISFQETMNWFEHNFEGVKLRELWVDWAKKNPDKVIHL